MKKNYVLDECALIATIKQENGALVVAELYEEAIKGGWRFVKWFEKVNFVSIVMF
jgi:PIN domain nuclease of toxin-antitoxin system